MVFPNFFRYQTTKKWIQQHTQLMVGTTSNLLPFFHLPPSGELQIVRVGAVLTPSAKALQNSGQLLGT